MRFVSIVSGICLLMIFGRPVHAQTDSTAVKSPAFRLSGTATITGDVYDFSSTPDSANRPRRPANLWRLILAPTLQFGDWLTLPFSIMISTRETNVTTPITGGSNFLQFLQNPGNNLGFLSISPRFSWAEFHLGTHVPMYSELSSGDGQVFGAGVDLRPGRFRFSASAGTIQRSIEPDSIRGVRGAYARWIYLSKIGFGTENGTFVDLNFVRAKDDPASVTKKPDGIDPQEGVLLTSNFRVKVNEQLFFTGEAGTSIFTQDMRAAELSNPDPALSQIIRQRISSRQDYAGNFSANYAVPTWGVKGLVRYIGAGYVALGYPYMQPDRLEFLLSPHVQLFENRLSMNASLGNRTNNLSNTKAAASNQFIGSINALGVVTEDLTISAGYSNFGVRNNVAQDTLRIETVAQSFNISPSYTLQTEKIVHSMSVTYSQDNFTDYNVLSGAGRTNVTQAIMGMYAAAFTAIPLSTNLSINHMTNDLPNGQLTVNSFSVGGGYRLLDGTLVPSLSVTYSTNKISTFSEDRQVYVRAAARWQVVKRLSWSLSISNNDYRYGSSRPGVSFNELLFQTSLSTQL